MISIDDFRKVELKIATVKSAELHPNADKLMVLQIDLGAEQRQICAGIRNHYTPEELVGKQVVVVANLETAKLRGLESQGMLLAVSDEGRVIILTPEKSVLAGAKVS
ncbi:MAG: methionine--tRNA ligase subunit beta [Deltaproteobacteria bacterium]|jgi:methionyl-tRNA synthetase|nr:MAG: methionine--tRNA ligase subunit beta [Deltaproteobacteria bacterium]